MAKGQRGHTSQIKKDLAELRRMAKWQVHKLDALEDGEIEASMKILKTNRGRGADHWAPREADQLSAEGKAELFDLIREIDEATVFPAQAGVNIISLKDKPKGGDRPIALQTFLAVLWATTRAGPTAAWDAKHAGWWDDAIKGSSVLQAALRRRANAEAAWLLGNSCVEAQWDIENFTTTSTSST